MHPHHHAPGAASLEALVVGMLRDRRLAAMARAEVRAALPRARARAAP